MSDLIQPSAHYWAIDIDTGERRAVSGGEVAIRWSKPDDSNGGLPFATAANRMRADGLLLARRPPNATTDDRLREHERGCHKRHKAVKRRLRKLERGQRTLREEMRVGLATLTGTVKVLVGLVVGLLVTVFGVLVTVGVTTVVSYLVGDRPAPETAAAPPPVAAAPRAPPTPPPTESGDAEAPPSSPS